MDCGEGRRKDNGLPYLCLKTWLYKKSPHSLKALGNVSNIKRGTFDISDDAMVRVGFWGHELGASIVLFFRTRKIKSTIGST